jgi:hypothetical protein
MTTAIGVPACVMSGSTFPPICTTSASCTAIPGSTCQMSNGVGFCFKSCTM